jgi:hypothetical protein
MMENPRTPSGYEHPRAIYFQIRTWKVRNEERDMRIGFGRPTTFSSLSISLSTHSAGTTYLDKLKRRRLEYLLLTSMPLSGEVFYGRIDPIVHGGAQFV